MTTKETNYIHYNSSYLLIHTDQLGHIPCDTKTSSNYYAMEFIIWYLQIPK
jgi:hypothetical protein